MFVCLDPGRFYRRYIDCWCVSQHIRCTFVIVIRHFAFSWVLNRAAWNALTPNVWYKFNVCTNLVYSSRWVLCFLMPVGSPQFMFYNNIDNRLFLLLYIHNICIISYGYKLLKKEEKSSNLYWDWRVMLILPPRKKLHVSLIKKLPILNSSRRCSFNSRCHFYLQPLWGIRSSSARTTRPFSFHHHPRQTALSAFGSSCSSGPGSARVLRLLASVVLD